LSYNDGRRVGFQEVDGRVYIDVTPAGTSLGSPIGRHVILLPEDVEALQEWLAEGPRMDLVGPVPPPVAPPVNVHLHLDGKEIDLLVRKVIDDSLEEFAQALARKRG